MRALAWLRRHRRCEIQTRDVGEWTVVEVRGKFVSGEAEELFRDRVDQVLDQGKRRVVVDLTRSHMGDECVATAAPAAYHRARSRGADMRFVVMPGRDGGFYHMAGLELAIPTYTRLGGAIEF
ncbi:MAG TPA: STAS domain-containing protein [Candidatus Polarisedimenticolia bacterium]|nr:STAS domain-containing protein [Candidatus Polarisedimenticolia bacterium]